MCLKSTAGIVFASTAWRGWLEISLFTEVTQKLIFLQDIVFQHGGFPLYLVALRNINYLAKNTLRLHVFLPRPNPKTGFQNIICPVSRLLLAFCLNLGYLFAVRPTRKPRSHAALILPYPENPMPHSTLFRRLILALQSARNENLKAQGLPEAIPYQAGNWSRRRFLQSGAIVGLGGAVAGVVPEPVRAWAANSLSAAPKIAVIGAGIAGLNAAYQLKKAGLIATVYEASGRVGGRMRSVKNAFGDGLTVDIGAELINTDHADMLALAQEFGIKLYNRIEDAERLDIPKEAFWFDGVAYGEAQVIKDLRPLAAQIAADSALLDSDYDTHAPVFDKWSVQDYLDHHADKIRAPYVRSLLENTIRSEYGVESGNSSALQLLFNLPTVKGQAVNLLSNSDEVYAVVGGSAEITDALAKAMPGQIKTNKYLHGIRKKPSGFRLSFADNSEVDADMVIIAIPFTVLRTIFIDAPMPMRLRRFIAEAMLGANEKLMAGFSRRFWRTEKGFSLAAWSDFGFSQVWDASQRQPGQRAGVLNFFLGGREVIDSQRVMPSALINRFVDLMEKHLPGAIAAKTGQFVRSRWLQNYLSFGAYSSFKPGQLTRFSDYFWIESDDPSERQTVTAGNLIFAGEHLSDEFFGFMNGAAQTGRLAAKSVMARWS